MKKFILSGVLSTVMCAQSLAAEVWPSILPPGLNVRLSRKECDDLINGEVPIPVSDPMAQLAIKLSKGYLRHQSGPFGADLFKPLHPVLPVIIRPRNTP